MQTNQTAVLSDPRTAQLQCRHACGEACQETCAYLRALERLRAWIVRAERAHLHGEVRRPAIGELWLLMAEVSTAWEYCPNCRGKNR
jgi:hypothetical protein